MITPATPDAIAKAAEILRGGGVVAMPTETVYGLAADALNAEAVATIFAIKQRPSFDPLIAHVSSFEQADSIALLSPMAKRLTEAFWPGPFTVVLPKRELVPGIVTSGLSTLALRMPAHPVARALIEAANTPLAAPSANLFGRVSPTMAEHVFDQLGDAPQMILDGGPCRVGLESTIVELDGEGVRLLRPGAVTKQDIEALGYEVSQGVAVHQRPQAPGMLASHYAPKLPLRLVDALDQIQPSPRLGALAFQALPDGFGAGEVLSANGDLREAAAKLFAAMRRLECADLDEIIAERLPEEGLGLAIMDRLRRAAHA